MAMSGGSRDDDKEFKDVKAVPPGLVDLTAVVPDSTTSMPPAFHHPMHLTKPLDSLFPLPPPLPAIPESTSTLESSMDDSSVGGSTKGHAIPKPLPTGPVGLTSPPKVSIGSSMGGSTAGPKEDKQRTRLVCHALGIKSGDPEMAIVRNNFVPLKVDSYYTDLESVKDEEFNKAFAELFPTINDADKAALIAKREQIKVLRLEEAKRAAEEKEEKAKLRFSKAEYKKIKDAYQDPDESQKPQFTEFYQFYFVDHAPPAPGWIKQKHLIAWMLRTKQDAKGDIELERYFGNAEFLDRLIFGKGTQFYDRHKDKYAEKGTNLIFALFMSGHASSVKFDVAREVKSAEFKGVVADQRFKDFANLDKRFHIIKRRTYDYMYRASLDAHKAADPAFKKLQHNIDAALRFKWKEYQVYLAKVWKDDNKNKWASKDYENVMIGTESVTLVENFQFMFSVPNAPIPDWMDTRGLILLSIYQPVLWDIIKTAPNFEEHLFGKDFEKLDKVKLEVKKLLPDSQRRSRADAKQADLIIYEGAGAKIQEMLVKVTAAKAKKIAEAAEARRVVEEAKQAAAAAEAKRLADERARIQAAEAKRLADEAAVREAERIRKLAEDKAADDARALAEEQKRLAEEKRQQAEFQRLAEEKRRAEEQAREEAELRRQVEQARLEQEAKERQERNILELKALQEADKKAHQALEGYLTRLEVDAATSEAARQAISAHALLFQRVVNRDAKQIERKEAQLPAGVMRKMLTIDFKEDKRPDSKRDVKEDFKVEPNREFSAQIKQALTDPALVADVKGPSSVRIAPGQVAVNWVDEKWVDAKSGTPAPDEKTAACYVESVSVAGGQVQYQSCIVKMPVDTAKILSDELKAAGFDCKPEIWDQLDFTDGFVFEEDLPVIKEILQANGVPAARLDEIAKRIAGKLFSEQAYSTDPNHPLIPGLKYLKFANAQDNSFTTEMGTNQKCYIRHNTDKLLTRSYILLRKAKNLPYKNDSGYSYEPTEQEVAVVRKLLSEGTLKNIIDIDMKPQLEELKALQATVRHPEQLAEITRLIEKMSSNTKLTQEDETSLFQLADAMEHRRNNP